MPDKFSGGCACGAIRYTCTAAPRYMGVPLSRLPACHGQCLLPGRAGAQRRFHARERGTELVRICFGQGEFDATRVLLNVWFAVVFAERR